MSVRETIQRRVNDVALDRDIKDYRAFGLWFLEEIEEMSAEAAEDALIDGAWDAGRDAVVFDEVDSSLTIYQFKYSENPREVIKGFTDLQRGLQAEIQNAIDAQLVRLIVVSMAPESEELLESLRNTEVLIAKWLENVGSRSDLVVEHFDMSKFTQIFEKLTGVIAQIEFREKPLESGNGLLGVIDARAFVKLIDKDELLAFNIRKFLGIRKNNINWKILRSLQSASEKERFWLLNNGLVCVYTSSNMIDATNIEYSNLSIVNGAQTVNTVAKFLSDNPIAAKDPIWVVAKLVQVSERDRDFALRLTVTSNTQNAVSYKDLRASEQSHEVLEKWLEVLGLKYQYKRGDAARGDDVVPMKDLAQAYVAFDGKPHVAFARAGTIFGENSELYTKVYPEKFILELNARGTSADRMAFLGPRLVAFEILKRIRTLIGNEVENNPNLLQWRSAAYHLVWMYGELIRETGVSDYFATRKYISKIVDVSFEYLFNGIQEFSRDRSLDIPKSLKGEKFSDDIRNQEWLSGSFFANKARKAIAEILR